MKTFVRKGVPIGCVLPCPCSHLLSSRSPLPPPLTPPLLPEDHWLTVHPPARSPCVWPQPGACQLVPLPRLALASIPGRCCSLFSLLLPAGPAHPHSPHCALSAIVPAGPQSRGRRTLIPPGWTLVTEVGLAATASGASLSPPRSSPRGPAWLPSGPVHPSFGFTLCSS